jgi:hypothetical protein
MSAVASAAGQHARAHVYETFAFDIKMYSKYDTTHISIIENVI